MNLNLFYRELGDTGENIIILHGLFGLNDNWVSMAKQLAQKYHLFLLDQRNHGQSPWSDEWSYEVMCDDLAYFIQSKNIENPVIIGHSMGGKTAMLFAAKYPELLAKLIVIDISPRYYPTHHQNIIEALKSIDLQTLHSRQEAEKQLESKGLDIGTRQFLLKNLYRKENNLFEWRMNLAVISQKIEEVGKEFPKDLFFEGSTLFVRGEKSNYITEKDFSIIQKFFPNAEIITIENAGHWVHAEQPQKLLEILFDFLS
jgi:pimeloyl-ACP methyl ester carboxylesterase